MIKDDAKFAPYDADDDTKALTAHFRDVQIYPTGDLSAPAQYGLVERL